MIHRIFLCPLSLPYSSTAPLPGKAATVSSPQTLRPLRRSQRRSSFVRLLKVASAEEPGSRRHKCVGSTDCQQRVADLHPFQAIMSERQFYTQGKTKTSSGSDTMACASLFRPTVSSLSGRYGDSPDATCGVQEPFHATKLPHEVSWTAPRVIKLSDIRPITRFDDFQGNGGLKNSLTFNTDRT